MTRAGARRLVAAGPAATFRQATELTKPQRDIYSALSTEPLKKIISLDPAPPTS